MYPFTVPGWPGGYVGLHPTSGNPSKLIGHEELGHRRRIPAHEHQFRPHIPYGRANRSCHRFEAEPLRSSGQWPRPGSSTRHHFAHETALQAKVAGGVDGAYAEIPLPILPSSIVPSEPVGVLQGPLFVCLAHFFE